jgi:hypothetical protein
MGSCIRLPVLFPWYVALVDERVNRANIHDSEVGYSDNIPAYFRTGKQSDCTFYISHRRCALGSVDGRHGIEILYEQIPTPKHKATHVHVSHEWLILAMAIRTLVHDINLLWRHVLSVNGLTDW